MAEIKRPWCYVDATGKYCKKGTPGAVHKRSATYRIRYYLPNGERKSVPGYRDKKATEALAAELERRALRVDAGLVDPAEVHAKRPLAEHAEDFRRGLAAKGNTPAYIDKALSRLTVVLDQCRFVRFADVQPSAVQECLAALRRDGKSIKTANDYLDAVKGFTRWLWRDRRTPTDALACLSRLPHGETDVRHARRDFIPEELRRLLDAARTSRVSLRRLAGIDRHFLYLTACGTGFRASELASMTPESFDLDGDPPAATVQAGCTKNRRTARQPLPRDIADALRPFLAGKPAGAPLWPGQWNTRAFLMIQRDLEAARVTWLGEAQDGPERARREASDFLSYRDAAGLYADFHALRHSYITMIGKTGVSPKEHQDLARHSTYALTGRYTHSRLYDLAAAVNALPSFVGERPETQRLAATGTGGRALGDENAPKHLYLNLVLQPAISGDFLRQTETEDGATKQAKSRGKHGVFAAFRGKLQSGGEMEPRGIEPLTVSAEVNSPQSLADTSQEPLSQTLTRESQKDPDLARLIDAWPTLPGPVRAGILAMIGACGSRNMETGQAGGRPRPG